MNLTRVKLLVLLLNSIFLFTATAKSVTPDGKIIGGQEAYPHSHPYLVSLQTRFLWVRVHFCGGSILNKRWILTAGHCALESWLIRWLPMDAVAGLHEVNEFRDTAQAIRIKERIQHPLYNGGIGPYDIALMRTQYPFTFNKFVKPVMLPKNFKYAGETLKLAGWGALRTTVFIPDMPSRLREMKATFVSYDDCYRAIQGLLESNEENPLNKEANICTGPTTGGKAACSGDSGGPLVQYIPGIIAEPNDPVEENTEKYNASYYNCNDETTTEGPSTNEIATESEEANNIESRQNVKDVDPVVLGIVSWGVAPCGEKGAPTVYTNVYMYIDFINYYIKNDNEVVPDIGTHKN